MTKSIETLEFSNKTLLVNLIAIGIKILNIWNG